MVGWRTTGGVGWDTGRRCGAVNATTSRMTHGVERGVARLTASLAWLDLSNGRDVAVPGRAVAVAGGRASAAAGAVAAAAAAVASV